MVQLPNVTMVIVDCVNYGPAINAIMKSLEQIQPAQTIFFTDKEFVNQDFKTVLIPRINSTEEYSQFILTRLYNYINTSHVLVIQSDGYVLDGCAWSDEFLEYDYIGAPWLYRDSRNVGNGGFSLRSMRLQGIMASDEAIQILHPEDEVIGRLYRGHLEHKHQIKFAPEDLAHKFSFELHTPQQSTFGFHGRFHDAWKPKVLIQRSASLGDIIMAEPLMEYYHKKGYMVVLNIPEQFFSVFLGHHYPVYHVTQLDGAVYELSINLDMAYEVNPKELVLSAYYGVAGIKDGEIRNSKLCFPVDQETKMFNRYIVLHIDDTGMAHRNIHGVNWDHVVDRLEDLGYHVFQVGTGNKKCGIKFNTPTKNLLMYLIAGADYFIGIDSGPGHIAVALGVKSILFFGSVNPHLRYPDMSRISVIQKRCPIKKDGCYHSVVSEVGTDCEVNRSIPPCINYDVEDLADTIQKEINALSYVQ